MDRPLAVGGLSGVASSLLVTLVRNFALEAQDQGFPVPNCIPSCLEAATLSIEEVPWVWFLGGSLHWTPGWTVGGSALVVEAEVEAICAQ